MMYVAGMNYLLDVLNNLFGGELSQLILNLFVSILKCTKWFYVHNIHLSFFFPFVYNNELSMRFGVELVLDVIKLSFEGGSDLSWGFAPPVLGPGVQQVCARAYQLSAASYFKNTGKGSLFLSL